MLNIKFLIRQVKFQINQKIILARRTELLRKLLWGTSLWEIWKDFILKYQAGLTVIHKRLHNASLALHHKIFLALNQSDKLLVIHLNMPWGGVGKGTLKNIVICGIKRQKWLKRPPSARRKSEFLPIRMENCSWSILNTYYVPYPTSV